MRRDPYPAYCFRVDLEIPGLLKDDCMYFKRIQGLKSETEVTEYQEGGCNGYTHRLVGPTKWGNLILVRGFSRSMGLIRWRERWVDGEGERGSGTIVQLNTALVPVSCWRFVEAWPCKWELSEFDASKNELSMETLELAHQGLRWIGSRPNKNDPQVFPRRPPETDP